MEWRHGYADRSLLERGGGGGGQWNGVMVRLTVRGLPVTWTSSWPPCPMSSAGDWARTTTRLCFQARAASLT